MGKRIAVESGRDRRSLVADAGWGRVSLVSVLAGVLVAYGAFAILAGAAGGILQGTGTDTDITARWGDLGVVAGLVVAVLLLVSYLFGGYVAGRMARRAGAAHGVAVFVLGVLIVAVLALVVRQAAGTEAIVDSLRDLGLPTSGDEWSEVGSVAGLASLVAMLAGGVLGGILGERWHARLLSRALDPDVGAEAEARRQAERAAAEAKLRHGGAQDRVDTASLRRVRDDQETPADRATPHPTVLDRTGRDESERAGAEDDAAERGTAPQADQVDTRNLNRPSRR